MLLGHDLSDGTPHARLANLLFSGFDWDARRIAEQFQRLAVTSYRSRSDEWPWASALVQQLAKKIATSARLKKEPVNALALAETLHIKITFVKRYVAGLSASLVPVLGGFEAAIYKKQSGTNLTKKEKFAIAHECGHVLFFYCDGKIPARIIPRAIEGHKAARREEELCDHFASALLRR